MNLKVAKFVMKDGFYIMEILIISEIKRILKENQNEIEKE
jgi:hypothetical protein